MPKRTLAVFAAAAFGALALPFGLPTIAHATGPSYNSISIKPLPLEQPGMLSPTGTNTVTACVQPLSDLHVVPGATVYLSIDAGLFTAPVEPGGSAIANGSTTLTATPQPIVVPTNTCDWSNIEGSGSLIDAIPVTYTGPTPTVPVNGRDVIGATSDGTSFDNSTGQCSGAGACNTATYVFSPVASYTFTPVAPIAPPGSLAAGAQVTFTVTALDDTSHPVPGTFIDLSLTTTASVPGTATGVNSFDGNTGQKVNDLPTRFGATNAGTVSVTYTASASTSGVDTITAQNHPVETIEAFTTYTYGSTAPFAQAPYTAITPFRVCDTRASGGGIPVNQCNMSGADPIASGASRAVTIEGEGVVPGSGVTAVVVNVTAIAPAKATFVTLYPEGGSLPKTSNVNPLAGEVVANLVEVGVSPSGQIEVYNAAGTAPINVALDVQGYVSSGSPGYLNATSPLRICDTRAVGPGIASSQCNTHGHSPINATTPLALNVTAPGSPVPTSGTVTAVVFNLTAIGPTAPTVLAVAPGGVGRPNVSNININPGKAVPNRIIVGVPSGCTTSCVVDIWNGAGLTDVAVDIDGWFGTSSASPASQFTALAPSRICDTQTGTSGTSGCQTAGTVGAGTAHVFNIFVDGAGGIPTLGSAHQPVAIVVNVTAVNASTGTYVTVFPGPAGAAVPNASDLNEPTFEPVTNLVIVKVGSDGSINLFNAAGNVNLIVDVLGYYS
jgi:hypothetical protein